MHRFAWAAVGWHGLQNADLWRRAHALLDSRGPSVALSKVKGHATCRDVAKGRVLERDKHGNDAADRLASGAAYSHSLPAHVVRAVLHRRKVVKAVQLMMIAILQARAQRIAHRATNCSSRSNDSNSLPASSSSCSESSESDLDINIVQHSLAIHSGSDHPT